MASLSNISSAIIGAGITAASVGAPSKAPSKVPPKPRRPWPDDREDICGQCRSIGWESAIRGDPFAPVKNVSRVDLRGRDHCHMCQFLVRSLGTFRLFDQHDLLAIRAIPSLTPMLDMKDVWVLGLVPRWDFIFRSSFALQSDIIFELSEATAESLRPILPLVDLATSRSWLKLCLDWHDGCCGTSGDDIDDLYVIDCSSRTIVPHPCGSAYITLSYVWGKAAQGVPVKPTSSSTSDARSLPSTLPQTIVDAMTVTLGLGYQYLWVDKYCMDPASVHFHTQLRQMHLVYHDSVLTIVAAAGYDGHYGLAGISRDRSGSPRTTIDQRTLTSVPMSVMTDLETCLWSSRGWTYQEGLLSMRRLVFTDRQMYYECQGYYCFEGVLLSNSMLKNLHRHDKQGFRQDLRGTQTLPSLEMSAKLANAPKLGVFPADRIGSRDIEIKYRIEEYSKRVLTFESDIINAMLGLFELFYRQFKVQHLWGIPFPAQDPVRPKQSQVVLRRRAFVSALNWTVMKNSHRREQFPSWSWSGWHGAVAWPRPSSAVAVFERWGEIRYTIEDPMFSIELETIGGDFVPWVSCEESSLAAIEEQVHDDAIRDGRVTRYLRFTAFVTRILLADDQISRGQLETKAKTDKPRLVDLDICLNGLYHPTSLYAVHLPWERPSWMIVICNLGNHWERVGLATPYYESDYFEDRMSIKKERLNFRLG